MTKLAPKLTDDKRKSTQVHVTEIVRNIWNFGHNINKIGCQPRRSVLKGKQDRSHKYNKYNFKYKHVTNTGQKITVKRALSIQLPISAYTVKV